MYTTDNGARPAARGSYRVPLDGPLPDLPAYERLIDAGIAAADQRGSPVDHVTARRLAIWLAARPQAPVFARGLDAATARTALFAIAAHADEREAHVREVEQFGQSLPEGSYGRRNREAIAARETRVATRLRAVEHAYRTAIEQAAVPGPPEPAGTLRPRDYVTDRQVDIEAEP